MMTEVTSKIHQKNLRDLEFCETNHWERHLSTSEDGEGFVRIKYPDA